MQPPAESSSESAERFAGEKRAPQVVLIGASVRAAAESARRAGFSVTGVDCFGDVDTRRACRRYLSLADGRAPVDVAGQLPAAAAVVVVGGLGGADALLRLLRERHAVFGSPRREPGCPSELVQLRRIAERSGMRVPPTFPAGQRPRKLERRRWLAKDADSAGGLGVRWAGVGETDGAVRAWYQRWIAGRSLGAVFLGVAGTAVLLGVCRSSFTRRGDRPFTYAGSFGPVPCHDRIEADLIRFGEAYAVNRAVNGLFNVDFILDPQNRIWVLEVNQRWSASCEVVEQALARAGQLPPPQTLFRWHWQAMTCPGALPDAWQKVTEQGRSRSGDGGERRRVWKRIVYCGRSGRFDPERLREAWVPGAEVSDAGTQIRFADLPQAGARMRRSDPLLTLICEENARWPLRWRTKRALITAAQQAVVPDG